MDRPYKLIMDGRVYRIRVPFPELQRSFRIPSGPNAGDMLDGSYEPDSQGTYYDYEFPVYPHPLYPEDYDAFFDAISAPDPRHRIIMPYSQTDITLDVIITGGSDRLRGRLNGLRRWDGLRVQFKSRTPYRRP